MSHDTD
jgi:ATP-binding cassette, subfamily B (MDR/TAP), member 1